MSHAPLCIPAVSCALQSIPNLDSCCINNPSGHFLQTQFWDTSPPLGGNESWTIHGLWPDYCAGGFDQYCNKTRSHSPERITQIIADASAPYIDGGSHPGLMQFMTKHWLSSDHRNSNLWAHEWNKHGTCISTLEPQCYGRDQETPHAPQDLEDGDVLDYFTHAALLYSTLPTFDFFARHGIVPSHEETYDLDHLRRAIRDSEHGHEAVFRCRNHNELSEIWYSFHVRADLRHAMDLWWDGNKQWNSWVPADPQGQTSNCPSSGIRYLPKGHQKPPPVPTGTTSQTRTATATATETVGPTHRPFTGKGRLMVKVLSDSDSTSIETRGSSDGAKRVQDTAVSAPLPSDYTGCLIRNGRWYAARSLTSCAIFTAHDDVESRLALDHDEDRASKYHLFTIASRSAPCSFVKSWETTGDNGPRLATNAQRQDLARAQTHLRDQVSLVGPSLNGIEGESTLPAHMFFSCDLHLPFQSILSNNATGHTTRMTLGEEHQYVFWTESVPRRNEQVRLWTDEDDENEDGRGGRRVKVSVFWEGV